MWISTESKAMRGWHLRTGHAAATPPAVVPKLGRGTDARDSFEAVFGATIAHLIANIGPTLRGEPEGMHQMRIALRALRAALQLFAPHLDTRTVDRFDTELRHICRIFGIARDWDVFCLQTLPAAMQDLPKAHLKDLHQSAEISRQSAHLVVDSLIRGQEFTATLLALVIWVDQRMVLSSRFDDDKLGRPTTILLPALLDRVARRVRKRGRHVAGLSPEKMHRYRKSLDLLCNDADVVAGLFPARRAISYRDRCTALQEILGVANDAVTTKRLARSLLAVDSPNLDGAAHALIHWSKIQRQKVLLGVKHASKRFRASDPFWR
jgi:CHAD domain-containing protein